MLRQASCALLVLVCLAADAYGAANSEPLSLLGQLPVDDGKITTKYDDHFRKNAKHFFGPGTDWRWFKSQGLAESNLDPNAKSWVGAVGVMQIMPATGKEISRQAHGQLPRGGIRDYRWNIAAGIYYDRQLYVRRELPEEDDTLAFMFASYNAGYGRMNQAIDLCKKRSNAACDTWREIGAIAQHVKRWRHRETLGYLKRIFGYMGKENPSD